MTKPVDPFSVDFRALQVLIRVHRLRSFTRASEELDMNQSAVSYTIDKLRGIFQDPLFVRQARRLLPTNRCDDIVEQIGQITADFRQLVAPTSFDPGTTAQKLVIACNYYERVLIIPPIVQALRSEAPNLDLEIIDASGIGQQRLMRNEADLLIGPLEQNDQILFRHNLYVERYVCLLDPDHPRAAKPLNFDDYLGLDHVLVTYGGNWRSRYIIELEQQGYELPVALRVPSPAGLELLVAGSQLVATVPERLSKKIGTGLHVAPYPVETQLTICLAWTALTHRSLMHQWVRDLICRINADNN